MIDNLDNLIDINLRLICESEEKQYFYPSFKDIDGKTLNNSVRLAEFMEQKALITINGQRCDLTEFGHGVHKFGGWLEFLRVQKETERQNELLENARQVRKDKADELDLGNKQWQFVTKKILFAFSIITLIGSGISIFISYKALTKPQVPTDLQPIRTEMQILTRRMKVLDSLFRADTLSRKRKK